MEIEGAMDSFVRLTQIVLTTAAREAFALLNKCGAKHIGIREEREETDATACSAEKTMSVQTIHASAVDAVSRAKLTTVIPGTWFLEKSAGGANPTKLSARMAWSAKATMAMVAAGGVVSLTQDISASQAI